MIVTLHSTNHRFQGWQNRAGNEYFEKRRQQSMNANEEGQIRLFDTMHKIGHEMDTLTGAFDLPGSTPTILDLCMAPGGFARYVLQRYPYAKVDALSLPEAQGGHKVRISYGDQDQRVSVTFTDLTKLVEESRGSDLSKNPNDDINPARLWPYNIERYDLVICDGQVPRRTSV